MVHARVVSLKLARHLKASGTVSSDGAAPPGCTQDVKVTIQRKSSSGWRNVKTTSTNDSGKYSVKMKDRKGKYRAKINETAFDGGQHVCGADVSPVKRHRH